jgi:hypothetical protein
MKRLWIVFAVCQVLGHLATWLLLTANLPAQFGMPLFIAALVLLFPGNALGLHLTQAVLSGFHLGVMLNLWIVDVVAVLINAAVWLLLFLAVRGMFRGMRSRRR